jgi:predicted transcriptional regulator of viral defense system
MAILRKTRMQIAKSDILSTFEDMDKKIFTPSQIRSILEEHRDFWRLANSTTIRQFVSFLFEAKKLYEVELTFPSVRVVRYIWGDVSVYELALSLNPDTYLTHYTSMYLHDLTEQIPKTIYVNLEQQSRPSNGGASLEQSRIDSAFKRSPRVSKAIAEYKDYKICLLHGMPTGQLGVIQIQSPEGQSTRVTDVERTLIDTAVRPFYSGGVFEVLKAYRLAKEKVSVNKLASYLKKMDYVYPYHQAIGFYLERSGAYKDSQINLLRKFGMQFDFYLTYQMKETAYSKDWRLYYPKGL